MIPTKFSPLFLIILTFTTCPLNAVQYLKLIEHSSLFTSEQHQAAVERSLAKKEVAAPKIFPATPLPPENKEMPLAAGIAAGALAAYAGKQLLFTHTQSIGDRVWWLLTYLRTKEYEPFSEWSEDVYHDDCFATAQNRISWFNFLVGAAGLYACYRVGKVAYAYAYDYCNAKQEKNAQQSTV